MAIKKVIVDKRRKIKEKKIGTLVPPKLGVQNRVRKRKGHSTDE